jgi:WxL domain surface cell wall-binding
MRNKQNHLNASARRIRIGFAASVCALAACVLPATALGQTTNDTTQFAVTPGSLLFGTAPDVPNLPALNLNGQAQTLNATMNSFSVADSTGSGSGYNVTVVGDTAGGKSPVFKQYCSNSGSACGADASFAYVAGGQQLAANSLTLNSTGAAISAQNGSTGSGPTHQCNSGCFVDVGSATKVLSAAANAGMGTFQTNSWTATSLALSAPTSVKSLPTNEIYHADLVWSLNSGP